MNTGAAVRHMRSGPSPRMVRSAKSAVLVPISLIAVVLIPILFGALRLVELAGGPEVMPDHLGIDTSPVPVVVHIISAVGYAVLGAFLFSTHVRRRWPRWHRAAGRVVLVLGLAVAVSALWMTLFYPRQPGTGELAFAFRLAFASGMAGSIVLGMRAVRRGDHRQHRAWMARGYALALGAGTQVFTVGFARAAFGSGEHVHDLSLGAGWVLNLAIAEYVISRLGRGHGLSQPLTGPKARAR